MSNVFFNKDHWKVPKVVETQNIEEDIEAFLGRDVFDKWKTLRVGDELREKIIVITERLEFIGHLRKIAEIAKENTTEIGTIAKDGVNIIPDKCNLFGHNFDGLRFDIEALNFYLYLTCIDTIQNKGKWHTRTFKKAFTSDIEADLKTKISEVFVVIKIGNGEKTMSLTDKKQLEKLNEMLEDWKAKKEAKRLREIADTLYDIRSRFTHDNIRSFCPIDEMSVIPYFKPNKKGILLWDKNYASSNNIKSIDEVLGDVIKELCLKKLNMKLGK